MRRIVAIPVAVVVLLLAANAGAAPAFTQATGSIAMSGPLQYASFDAKDYGDSGDRGNFWYTNFEYPVPGTGVWVPYGTLGVDFYYAGGGPYTHVFTITGFEPLAPNSVSFTATGYYAPTPAWTETVAGTIVGDQITFTMIPDDGGAMYTWTWTNVQGTIAPGGSVSGTWNDSMLRTGEFQIADIGHEVFSYTASVHCATDLGAADFDFAFYIPAGVPLAGYEVVVKVHDGGSPGAVYDTYGHALGTCGGTTSPYTITSGNLMVHS